MRDPAIALLDLVLLLAGCAAEHAPRWVVRFEDESTGRAATLVRARIVDRGCRGTGATLFETVVEGSTPAMDAPPLLPSGRYGFSADALDDTCHVVATGCIEIDLPRDEDISLVLANGPGVAECPPGTCAGGVCDASGVVALATGRAHTCAFDFGKRLYCWGHNENGQLGNGTLGLDADEPSPVVIDTGVETSALAAGGIDVNWRSHTCARVTGGVRCWGYNAQGQVGDGTTVDRPRPTDVPDLTNASNIAAGGRHTCAVLDSGEAVCWGANDFGQLGDGGAVDHSPVPVATSGPGAVVQVALGLEHSCARTVAGNAFCWGRNEAGQLGDGTRDDRPRPVDIGLRVVTAVAAGSRHTCAVMSDGTVQCWGANDGGQLGRPSTELDSSTVPSPVDGVSEAVEIALGASTSCARVTSGSVLCWGRDTFGQLGRGEIGLGSIPVPGPVVGLDDAIRIDFGSDHGCAIRASGDLVCWGRNQYGRLGDGTLEDRGTPVLVLGPSL